MVRHSFLIGLMLFLAACSRGGGENVNVENSLGKETFPQAMPANGKLVDADHGEEVWLAYGPVSGMGNVPANGVIMAHFFADGTFIMTAQVNIAIAAEATFYEGWLLSAASGDQVSLGHLVSHFGDARHFLKFESERDLRGYSKALFTLERDDGDAAPSKKQVAEGALRETKR